MWWIRSPDPQADVATWTDPATYGDLVDRAARTIEDVIAGADRLAAPDPVALPVPDLANAPPRGLEEAAGRLAPAVEVAEPSPAYAFAALQDDGVTPVAWSPCRPIHYVVNETGAPEGFLPAVRGAVAEVAAATGLVFVYDGTTSEAPTAQRESYRPDVYGDRWAPVLVAVTDPATVPYLDGQTAGVANTFRVSGSGTGVWHLVSGSVFIDVEAFEFPQGSAAEPPWLGVVRHELGHLVGLDHVDDPSQLMNPVTSTILTFQAGDRTGLALLGQGACAPAV